MQPCVYVLGYNRYMPKSVSLAAVQMQYRLEDYRSTEAFRERVLGVMRAVRQRAPKGDLLVRFSAPPGYDGYFALKRYLEALLGAPVNLVMEGALRRAPSSQTA